MSAGRLFRKVLRLFGYRRKYVVPQIERAYRALESRIAAANMALLMFKVNHNSSDFLQGKILMGVFDESGRAIRGIIQAFYEGEI